MASQILTVVKIGGVSADAVRRQFLAWQDARLVDDPNEWEPNQWPEDVRSAADQWADAIRAHGHEPPVVFFSEFADLWSFCPPQRFLGHHQSLQVYADRYELFCLPLPLASDGMTELSALVDNGQWDEDRYFASNVLSAINAWEKLVDDAVIVLLRRVIGGAVEDHEIEATLRSVPDWLAGS